MNEARRKLVASGLLRGSSGWIHTSLKFGETPMPKTETLEERRKREKHFILTGEEPAPDEWTFKYPFQAAVRGLVYATDFDLWDTVAGFVFTNWTNEEKTRHRKLVMDVEGQQSSSSSPAHAPVK